MSTHSLLCAIIAFGKMHCSLSMAARGLFFTPQLGTWADPAWGLVGLEPPYPHAVYWSPLQFLAMNEEEEEEKVKKEEGKERKKEEDGKLNPPPPTSILDPPLSESLRAQSDLPTVSNKKS